jgi:protein ImuA
MENALALAALKHRIERIDSGFRQAAPEHFTTGNLDLDEALHGGLAVGRLHELYAAGADDWASSAGFAAMLALRLKPGALAWLRTEAAERQMGQLYMPGLAELGGDPGSSILMLVADDKSLLRTAADAAACPGLGVLVVEWWGKAPLLTLTASRRLALAAEKSGVTLFLLRLGTDPAPSAATTRWRISAAPSIAMAEDAPGPSMIEVELLRQRSGPSGMRWQMEWDRDRRTFREPQISGAVAAVAEHRAADPGWRDERRSA